MRSWGALAMALALAGTAHAGIPDGVAPVLAAALVNGKSERDPVLLWQDNGAWVAESATWAQLGVVLKPGETGDLTDTHLGVTLQYNAENATVELVIPADRKPAQQLSKTGNTIPTVAPAIGGLLVNYNLATQWSDGKQATSAALDLRTGGRWGVLSSTGQLNQSPDGFEMRRGMTTWGKDDVERQISAQAGDVYATPRGGPVALGGFRIAKDPGALDPLTPTYPVPMLGGLAMDPGTVRVLANQAEVSRQDVKAGPFTLDGRHLAQGASQTAVVVRDAYSRETAVSTQRLYVAPSLLRPGLSTWELAAGRVREDENRYGAAGVSGNLAWGINDRWTLRAGGQADELGNHHVTVGSTQALGTWGVFDVEAGTSTGGGTRWAAAYDYRGRVWGIRLQHERNRDFWRLQSELSIPVEQRTQASVSFRPNRRLSVQGTYSAIDTGRANLAFVAVGASLNLGAAGQVSANVLRDIQGGDLQVAGSYTYRFNRKASVGVRARQAPGQNSVGLRGNYRTENGVRLAAELQDGDWGTQARVTADASTRWGDARMEASQYDGKSSVSGSVAGALFIDHQGIAFGRPAYSSYAVVDVPGQAGIPVRVGGSPAGVTNAQGRVLVTNVSGLLPTEVSLKDKELPMGVEIGETKKSVTAPRQGGVRVTFPVLTQNARAFTLTGKAIPPGSMATTSTEQAVVGFDGALYLGHPEPGQTVEITDVCKGNLPSPLAALGEVNVVKCN